MFTVIGCTQCNKGSSFDIEITFTPKVSRCKSCNHISDTKWTYYFCDIECFEKWRKANKVEEKGFPCRDCVNYDGGKSTGFLAGFKVNGPCPTCKGALRVTASKKENLKFK